MLVPAPFSQCRYKYVSFQYQCQYAYSSILRRVIIRGGANNMHMHTNHDGSRSTRTIKDEEDETKDGIAIMGGAVDDWMKSFEEQVQSLRLEMEAEAKREMEDLR
eukprot:scaffold49843_cov51-Attheya_sp.AAC.1